MKLFALFSSLVCLLSLAVFMRSTEAVAQPMKFEIRKVSLNYPNVEATLDVQCGGQFMPVREKSKFHVFEAEREITDFTVSCPDVPIPCLISASLVFDVSGSMTGGGIAGAKAAGTVFVDRMDGVADQAAIVAFNSNAWVVQGMTHIKPLLYNAINGLSTGGSTALWDGIHTGTIEVIATGSNPCRAVIVVSDGAANAGSRTPTEVIALASRNNVRIFTVALGSATDSLSLQAVASQTGGRYYSTIKPEGLSQIFKDIEALMRLGFVDCTLRYQTECKDGSTRKLRITLDDVCSSSGPSITRESSITLPKDANEAITAVLRIGSDTVRAQEEFLLPFVLETPINPEALFAPFTMVIGYSVMNGLEFKGIAQSPGTLLESAKLMVSTFGTPIISMNDLRKIGGPGVLFFLRFKAPDFADTIRVNIRVAFWSQSNGCILGSPVMAEQELPFVLIVPRQQNQTVCSVEQPIALQWEKQLDDYSPNPFDVTFSMTNTGNTDLSGVRFHLLIDRSKFNVVAPTDTVQSGTPSTVEPGKSTAVQWTLRALPRFTTVDTVPVQVLAEFDNHGSVFCTRDVILSPTGPRLTCAVNSATVTYNMNTGEYSPMPFPMSVDVTNIGGLLSDTITATIDLPAGLSLGGPDVGKPTKILMSPRLQPNGQGATGWFLHHDLVPAEKRYTITVRLNTPNAPPASCATEIVIPAADAPLLTSICSVPSRIRFDSSLVRYDPDEFDVSFEVRNMGTRRIQDIVGWLVLPSGFSLAVPGDSLVRHLPGSLEPYKSGDPVRGFRWRVKIVGFVSQTKDVLFILRMEGFDTVVGKKFVRNDTCTTQQDGVRARMQCLRGANLGNPDTLRRTMTGTDVEPNPFLWRAMLTNLGPVSKRVTKAVLLPQTGDVRFDPTTPDTTYLNTTINPGDTIVVSWLLHAEPGLAAKYFSIISIWYDDEAVIDHCDKSLVISAVLPATQCTLSSTDTLIRYDRNAGVYTPSTWIISGRLTNTGRIDMNNVSAELLFSSPVTPVLVEFDPAFPDNTNPKQISSLPTGQAHTFLWGLKIANSNTTAITQSVPFSIQYRSDEMKQPVTDCNRNVHIESSLMVNVERGIPNVFSLSQNYPNPFKPVTRIDFTLPMSSTVRLAIYDLHGREVRVLVNDRRDAGSYQVLFDAEGLPGGVYVYRLEAAGKVLMRRMAVVR